MKKISSLLCVLVLLSLCTITNAQTVFWTEGFGSGCNQGQTADGITTTNGTWAVTQPGYNDPNANLWYISAKEAGTGAGNCSNNNCGGNNQSLHVSSNDDIATNDAGCNYDAGGLCSALSICVITDARAESPIINCTGRSTITLTFNYIEGGDGSNDNATCWYYNGASWALLVDMPKTTGCAIGKWTSYSFALPASANNNPNVKIGFRWVNNDDGVGTDPSIAVDDIQLSVPSVGLPPVAKFTASDSTGCTPFCPVFTDASTNNPTAWLWTFPGATISSSTLQNPVGICYDSAGTYSVKLKVTNGAGTDSITLTNYVTVHASPPTPTITQGHDTLFCSFNASYTSYQWYDSVTLVNGATLPYYIITHSGNYNVSVGNENGCVVAVGTNVTYTHVGIKIYSSESQVKMYPNPAINELTLSAKWQSNTGLLSIYNILGEEVKEENIKLNDLVTINVKNLSKGIYFMQIATDTGRWTGRFVKD